MIENFRPTHEKIYQFTEENRFLSSMYEFANPIIFEPQPGIAIPAHTVEQPYQASKFIHINNMVEVVNQPDGYAAKKHARKLERAGIETRPDWDQVKIEVMYKYQKQKYQNNPDLLAKLLDTANAEIEEGNRWQDRYWGISPAGSGNGLNHLGRILMQIRQELTN